ncbi:RNase adapter RapZ [Salinibius halmophilus]|uniref:RNase adapter RapZ n=1 Tax=Salinibius halmophilus TaxID=1853216 RepID=UPI000E673984|nr:RNase adapter RapZ [Salinibius halmophilus]
MNTELIIVSGRSGAGKTIALSALEDCGYHSIDNLPLTLLPDLVDQLSAQATRKVAVCIDARNAAAALHNLDAVLRLLAEREINTRLLFLQCSNQVLIQRFSETRRKHPLSTRSKLSLQEALDAEIGLVEPLRDKAELHIDTSQLSVHDLRSQVQEFANAMPNQTALTIMSFGFKHGIPLNADYVFDVRCLPNPYWQAELRPHYGTEQPIIDFLANKPDVNEMIQDIERFCLRWLSKLASSNRAYLTVAIGCTGGHHRSVYVGEQLCKLLTPHWQHVRLQHREISHG